MIGHVRIGSNDGGYFGDSEGTKFRTFCVGTS